MVGGDPVPFLLSSAAKLPRCGGVLCLSNREGKAMAKSGGGKTTSPKAASAASKVLNDGRTGNASKTAAGSALSQKEKSGKK
jgi:hypothetical protein